MQTASEQDGTASPSQEGGTTTPALRPRPSLASRALLAFALMVGFYVLAIAVAVGLLGLVYAEWALTRHVNARLAFFAIAGACLILWSIIPRPERFTPPGPRLDADTQPRLFQSISEVSRATGQEMPSEVYLVPDVNAWVGQRGGMMGFGGRKVMGIGLGLLQALTASQLKAVIAHEFGHYYGGDTRLGPLIYRTREAIFRSLRNLARHSSVLQKPFIWYARAFLRVTHSVSRQQEFVADELAARVAGARVMADSLRATHAYGLAFDSYWQNEVVPVLGAGHRPPIAEGFKRFVDTSTVSEAMRKSVESELQEGTTDPYDTHPSLSERLAALQAVPSGEPPTGDPPAISLLNNVQELEKGLLAAMAGEAKIESLRPVTWELTGTQALLPEWRETVREHRRVLSGITPMALPDVTRDLSGFGAMLLGSEGELPEPEVLQAGALTVLGAAMAVGLHGQGWDVSALPGEPVVCSREGARIEPFNAVADLASGKTDAEAWRETCRAGGIADLDLGGVA